MNITPEDIPYSAACERNQDAILKVISAYLSLAEEALEVGTGTAQHAVHFASAFPGLNWQTSDQAHYLDGIHAQLAYAAIDNIALPIELDVNQQDWGFKGKLFDLIYTSNTLHIMSENDVVAFFSGLSNVTSSNTILVVYGPFKYAGEFTSVSNHSFDQSLRSRDCGSFIKNFEIVNALAEEQGFQLIHDHAMLANNQCLIWQKV